MTPLEQSVTELHAQQFEVFEYEYEYRVALEKLWDPPGEPSPSNRTERDDGSAAEPPPSESSLDVRPIERSAPDPDFSISFSLVLPEPTPWSIAFTPSFRKSIQALDKKMQGRVLVALAALSEEPAQRLGDTVKPLTAGLKGMWRYRIGDYRLVYEPLAEKRTVVLVEFGARGGVYED